LNHLALLPVENADKCRAVNMLATLRVIKEKFGGAEGYVIEKCGLSKEEVEKLKSNLIVEKPAVHDRLPGKVSL
jgi:hypothetical protein